MNEKLNYIELHKRAEDKARNEAERLYPEHLKEKREEAFRRLFIKYYNQYTRP